MEKQYFEEQTFSHINYTEQPLKSGVYEHCHFVNCNLGGVNLSAIQFAECVFDNCDLSMCMLGETAFQEVSFKDCKMLGLHFEHCKVLSFEVSFDNCTLTHSCFYQRNLRKTLFKKCVVHEVDFTEADLAGAVFDHCDMAGAVFDQSVLEKADFRTAWNFTINPETNRIKKALFSANGLAGLLGKYDIVIE